MFMTAAGGIAPAKVLILGAGVAGLQAIATARRLGAVVEVFDTRHAVKEEVMSLGAKIYRSRWCGRCQQSGRLCSGTNRGIFAKTKKRKSVKAW